MKLQLPSARVALAIALAAGGSFVITKLIVEFLAPRLTPKLRRLMENKPELSLNEHEAIIANDVVFSNEIDTGFESVAGIQDVIRSIQEFVLYPLKYPQLFDNPSGLLTPPKGVLLYGPPGCGKSMIAKAIAKEAGASFINVKASTLTDKWYGESQKLTRALFTLANKLQPCIIFIDEIDSFLRERRSSDHEVTAMVKAEFMALWDGLQTGQSTRVIILGATNRPQDIDSAVLRRLPKRFRVDLPDQQQRLAILRLLLKKIRLEDGFDFDRLAAATDSFSGSDLKELCRSAAMEAIKDTLVAIRQREADGSPHGDVKESISGIRPLVYNDFIQSELYRERHQYTGIMLQQQQQNDLLATFEALTRRT